MSKGSSTALADLTRRLSKDRVARVFLANYHRYRDIHLKDLIVEELDDERRMRVNGRLVINFGSDSFLGLDRDPRVRAAIISGLRWGTHNGTSRAFTSVAACAEAERRLARWLGVEDTLIYPSVTLANSGLLPGLAGRGILLVVDRLAHESIHEGARLAASRGARVVSLDPCEPEVLGNILASEGPGGIVGTDGVYSMTGTSPPLAELDVVARSAGFVLYIDDAHGTGLVGERGRGAACKALGHLQDVVMVGSLSKAFSCLGAFATCTPDLKLLMKMVSSTYIFGGPVAPPYLEGVIAVCDILESDEYPELIGRLRRLVSRLVAGARGLCLPVLGGETPIVSLRLGGTEQTFAAGKWLFDRGFYVQSVVFPAVPLGKEVLRIQVNANHSTAAIDGLLGALADMKRALRLPTQSDSIAL